MKEKPLYIRDLKPGDVLRSANVDGTVDTVLVMETFSRRRGGVPQKPVANIFFLDPDGEQTGADTGCFVGWGPLHGVTRFPRDGSLVFRDKMPADPGSLPLVNRFCLVERRVFKAFAGPVRQPAHDIAAALVCRRSLFDSKLIDGFAALVRSVRAFIRD